MVLTFLIALLDSLSSVLYVPYMAHFKPSYLMPFMIGESLSGLIPAMVSFLQGTFYASLHSNKCTHCLL